MTLTLVRRFLVVGAILALASVSASATTCASLGGGSPTLADVLATGSGGCTIGDLLFANFDYLFTPTGVGATAPATTSVAVGADATNNPLYDVLTFTFSGTGVTVAPNQTLSLMIQYTATWTGDPSYYINEVDLDSYGGKRLDTNGTATFTQLDCLGGAFSSMGSSCGGSVGPGAFAGNATSYSFAGTNNNNPPSLSDEGNSPSLTGPTFSDVTTIGMYNDVELVGGTNGTDGVPQAGILSLTNYIDEEQSTTPEPATLLLIGSALVGLGVLRRKRA
jgi:hypothetical protein